MRPTRTASFFLLASGLLAACASNPRAVPESALSGSWRNADGVSVAFEQTGVMSVDMPGPRPKTVLGEWSMADGVITIRYRPESRMCVDDVGQYRVLVSAETFEASAVRESCEQRRKSFEGVWKRTAAARPVPGG